jgi:hypothetical protein
MNLKNPYNLMPYLQTNKLVLASFINEAFTNRVQSAQETGW